MILTLLLFVLYCKRKQKKNSPTESCEGDRFLRVSYGELFKATEGFSSSNLIGAGSFSTVYKGVLPPQDKVVAVKVLDIERLGASKSFFAVCVALRKTRHRNLLKIITACSKRLSYLGPKRLSSMLRDLRHQNIILWMSSFTKSGRGTLDRFSL